MSNDAARRNPGLWQGQLAKVKEKYRGNLPEKQISRI
jgi:hypothetical protein